MISIRARQNPLHFAKEISWQTIAPVAGLFIMVDAVENIGALNLTQSALHWIQGLVPAVGALVTTFTVAVANNLVNNLPLGLIAGGTLRTAPPKGLLASAVLIGVDLGPKVGAVARPVPLLASVGGAILIQILFETR